MIVVPNHKVNLRKIPKENRFGAVRKHDIHTGLDIFTIPFMTVVAYEDGVVTNVCDFTGDRVGSPWWNNTQAVCVEGESGVILYGEISPHPSLTNWKEQAPLKVKKGQILGTVLPVLKTDKGKPTSMLHIELYEHGYRGDGEVWITERPKLLLNVETLFRTKNPLKKIYEYIRNKRFTFSSQENLGV